MAEVVGTRKNWRCPLCGRKYRIPADTQTPAMCPGCTAEEKSLAAKGTNIAKKELSLSKDKPTEPVVTTTFFAPVNAEQQPKKIAAIGQETPAEPNVAVDSLVTRAEIDEALENLANISQTMTMIRRSLTLVVLITLISVTGSGYFIWKLSNGPIDQGLQAIQAFQQPQPAQLRNIPLQPDPNPNRQREDQRQQGSSELLKTLRELLDGEL